MTLLCKNILTFSPKMTETSRPTKKMLFLAVFERVWPCKTNFGIVEVKTDIVFDIKLNADYDSDIILGHKMTFFHDMVEIMSKIAVFDRFLAVTAQNFQNFQKKMSFSNS